MKIITFPEFGLRLTVNNIAMSLLGINIYWYAFFIVVALIVAMMFCKKDDGKYNIKFDDILELFVIMLPITIVCARLYFVLFKLDYYIKYPNEILNIRNRWVSDLWWDNWCSYYNNDILQNKENKYIRHDGLYSTIFSTSDKQ